MKRILAGGMLALSVCVTDAQSIAKATVFTESKCPFAIPSGERATCGYLTVPENRDKKSTKKIKLFVTIVKSYSHTPKTDPIVSLVGKLEPAPSTGLMAGKYWEEYAPLRQDRDMIFIDQRGSGLSSPSLVCKNLPNPALISKQDYLIRLKNCRDEFNKKKIDLSSFNTKESAQDVIALMRSLNYKQWNILGTSFGSRVALAIMSIGPQHVRSVVLNSSATFLPEATPSKTLQVNNDRIFKQFFYDCGVDPGCKKKFPNLKDVYLQLIQSLPKTTSEDKVGAPYVISVISREIANKSALQYLPQTIYELSKINAKGGLSLEKFKSFLKDRHYEQADSNMSYICYDAGGMIKKANGKETDSPFYIHTSRVDCNIWAQGNALKVFEKVTFPSIPTMILTGEYDTILPSVWSQEVAKQLPNAKLFRFKGVGNDVVGSLPCALFMAAAFFDRPDHKPEDACMMALKPPVFYAPSEVVPLSRESNANKKAKEVQQ